MVDFATEVPVDVRAVTERFRVTHDTVYRWFKRGLEHAKVGGKVVTTWQAINRFSRQSDNTLSPATPVFIDRETAAALRSLNQRLGIKEAEANSDGRKSKTAAR